MLLNAQETMVGTYHEDVEHMKKIDAVDRSVYCVYRLWSCDHGVHWLRKIMLPWVMISTKASGCFAHLLIPASSSFTTLVSILLMRYWGACTASTSIIYSVDIIVDPNIVEEIFICAISSFLMVPFDEWYCRLISVVATRQIFAMTSEKSSWFSWPHAETWELISRFHMLDFFILHVINLVSVLVSRLQPYCTGHSSGMGLSEFSNGSDTWSEQGIGDGSLGAAHTSKSSCPGGLKSSARSGILRGSGRGCRCRSTPLKSVKVWIFTPVSPG